MRRLILALVALAPAAAMANPALIIQHSGRLIGGDDAPATGAQTLTFEIHTLSTPTAQDQIVWTTTQKVTVDEAGLYAIALGDVSAAGGQQPALSSEVFAGDRWLAIRVNDVPLTPWLRIGAVPAAAHAAHATTAGTAAAVSWSGGSVALNTNGKWPASALEVPSGLVSVNESGVVPDAVLPSNLARLGQDGKLPLSALPTGPSGLDAASLGGHTPEDATSGDKRVALRSAAGVLDADTVAGFGASTTPAPNTLLALDANGRLPVAAIPAALAGTFTLDGKLGIGAAPTLPFEVGGKSALRIPAGTTAERSAPINGALRFNTETGRLEFADGTAWQGVGGYGPRAAGGTVTDIPGYRVHTFTTTGVLNVSVAGKMDVLIVGGGGAGGGRHGGGGGGGGVLYLPNAQISTGSYPIVVGAGAPANTGCSNATGGNGENSSAFGETALGGGGGGAYLNANASAGGSGGGAGHSATLGGATTQANPSGYAGTGYGHPGGYNQNAGNEASGGGGAGGPGSPAIGEQAGGNGGLGVLINIDGNNNYWGGGGGGGLWANAQGVAGTGGAGGGGGGGAAGGGTGGTGGRGGRARGGAGTSTDGHGGNGAANTGGGGGGSAQCGASGVNGRGGAGGSGIVIVRYAVP